MKKLTPNTLRSLPVCAGIALGLLAGNANAANEYFHITSSQTDYGIVANTVYDWDAASPNQWTTSATGAPTSTWPQGNFPRFNSTITPYTVRVNGTVSILGMYAHVSTVSLTISAAGSGNLSIVPNATTGPDPAAQGFYIAGNVYITAPITGAGGMQPQYVAGSPNLYLRAHNTYSGGTLFTSSSTVLYPNNNDAFGVGTNYIDMASGTYVSICSQGGATLTFPNHWTNCVSGGGVNFAADANTPVVLNGSLALGPNNLNLRNNGVSTSPLTVQGPITGTGALTLSGNNSGTIILNGANTYSGQTLISAGNNGIIAKVTSLNKVSGGNPSSSLGAPTTTAAGTIAIGSGALTSTLVYTGAGETTDRIINLAGTTGGAILQNDGSGALTFTSAFTATGAGSKTLTLQGNNTGANTISGAIVDNSTVNKTSVTKAGTGTWVLAGANTYTGGTTVTGGTLTLQNSAALAASSTLTVSSGATVNLNLSGLTNTINTLVIDGVVQLSGVWGAPGSGAPNSSSIFVGNGFLNVAGKPTITQQPVGGAVLQGNSFTFSVEFVGDSTGLTYTWKHNGSTVGANSASYTIDEATLADAGNYSVVVHNNSGDTTSATAFLYVASTNAYTTAIVADQPISYWRLGETNGTLAYDFGSGGALGLYNNAVKPNQLGFSEVDKDPAIGLGPNAYSGVKVTNMSHFAFNVSQPFTLEGWMYFSNTPSASARLLSTMGGDGWGLGIADATHIQFTLSTVDDYNSPTLQTALQGGVWYYLAATFNPAAGSGNRGQFVLYFNGQPVRTWDNVANFTTSTTLFLGCDPATFPFSEGVNGRIDEVAIYGQALSDTQIKAHYDARYLDAPPQPALPLLNPATNYVSFTTTLTENAVGGGLHYQWYKVPSDPKGSDSSVLTLANLTLADAGYYYVQVNNGTIYTNSPTNYVAVLDAPASADQVNLTNGLVLHLPLDTDYKDISGRHNNGTAVGTPSFTAGIVGNGALVYGTSSTGTNYVTMGSPADLKFGATTDFTVAYWVRGTANTGLPFFCNSTNAYSGITNYSGGFYFGPNISGNGGWEEAVGGATHVFVAAGADIINDGNWHQLVHVANRAGNMTTYLDGLVVDARAMSFVTESIDTTWPVNIGQDGTGKLSVTDQSGDIDDVGVWKRQLSAFEIDGMYLAGKVNHVSFAPVALAPVTIAPLTVGSTTLSYSGGGGSTFTLYSSTDLVNWTQVGSAQNVTPGSFTIPAVGSGPAVFYRVKSQ